jgi:hypothetical protein
VGTEHVDSSRESIIWQTVEDPSEAHCHKRRDMSGSHFDEALVGYGSPTSGQPRGALPRTCYCERPGHKPLCLHYAYEEA